jgi:hypothetical protein
LQRSASLIASAALLLSIIAATAIAAHYATPIRGQPPTHTITATTTVVSTTNTTTRLMVTLEFPNGSRLETGNLTANGLLGSFSSGEFNFSGIRPGTYQFNLTGAPSTYLPPISAQVSPGENFLNLTIYQLAVFHLVNTPNLAFNGTQPGPIINVKNATAVRLVIYNNTTQIFNVAVVRDLYNTSLDNVLFNSLSSTISAGGSVNGTFIASAVGTFYYQSMTGNQAKQGEYGYFTVSQ